MFLNIFDVHFRVDDQKVLLPLSIHMTNARQKHASDRILIPDQACRRVQKILNRMAPHPNTESFQITWGLHKFSKPSPLSLPSHTQPIFMSFWVTNFVFTMLRGTQTPAGRERFERLPQRTPNLELGPKSNKEDIAFACICST